jgi:hypothetical protein
MGLVFVIIVMPGLICITVSGFGILLVNASTSAIKNKSARDAVRALLYACVVGLSIYALSKGVFSPRLGPWR